MDLVSLSPLPIGGYAWRPRCGGHAFVVIAKATFELVPGMARLADNQDGLNETDNHWDDDPACSVYAPSDMAPFKERADVTLVGNAHSPTAKGARNAIVRVSVAGMDKKVAVHCDRHLDEKGRVVEGKPFKRMALRYERAAGGRLSDNPVGIEPATKKNRAKGTRRLPNLQTVAGGRKPAGFGPLGSRWPMRRRLLRSAAKRFQDARWRELPLPSALDCTYFNDAPADQRVNKIRANERILLENLHPRHPRLSTRLPGVMPRAFAEIDGEVVDINLTADSLWIDMTRGVCTVTWRGSFEIADATTAGRVLVALQQPGEELTYEEVAPSPRATQTSGVELTDRASTPPANLSDSGVGSILPPAPTSSREGMEALRPRMNTVDLAAGAEDFIVHASKPPTPFVEPDPTATLVAHTPMEALPFLPPRNEALGTTGALPAASPTPVPPSTPASPSNPASPSKPAITPPTAENFSPWAGRLSSANHTPQLPTTEDRASVTPPPLMLVPAPSAPPVRGPSGSSLLGALPSTHRVEVIGSVEQERIQQKWEPTFDERPEDKLNRELKEAFGEREELSAVEMHRHLVRVMSRNDAAGTGSMREMMKEAVDEDGVFTSPLALTHGLLRLTFDAVETLRATMASVATYLKDNDSLREEVENARDILNQQQVAPEAAQDLTDRIRDAFSTVENLDVAKVDSRIERMLLESRAYETKKVFGDELVRGLLTVSGEIMPVYIPAQIAMATPLYTELCVRIIAELHPRQDQHENSTRALRAIALGRVVAREEEC